MKGFLHRVASDPSSLSRHVRRFGEPVSCSTLSFDSILRRSTGTSGLRITYGYNVEEDDGEFIKITDTGVERFNIATMPGAFLADTFPFCEFF